MRISDWSSDVCSSDLSSGTPRRAKRSVSTRCTIVAPSCALISSPITGTPASAKRRPHSGSLAMNTGMALTKATPARNAHSAKNRSEEHTSELQSLMRISYAVFCLKKKTKNHKKQQKTLMNMHIHTHKKHITNIQN